MKLETSKRYKAQNIFDTIKLRNIVILPPMEHWKLNEL